MELNPKPVEKQALFVTLRRLAERLGRLPERITITENVEVSDEVLAFDGFGAVRDGIYKGERVAVKTANVPFPKDFGKIRKVSITVFSYPPAAPSQPFCSSGFTGRLSSGVHYPIRTF